MAYDEGLATRVRDYLEGRVAYQEKKMFGGLCFLVGGHMTCGITKDDMMVRVGPKAYEAMLARDHAREMDFTGRALKGMVYVAPPGLEADADLASWIEAGVGFALSLPPKT